MANTISGFNVIIAGYPQQWGTKNRVMWDHYGPASYANVLTNSGKGDVINAADVGFGGFDEAETKFGGYSQDGNYICTLTITAANANNPGNPLAACTLQWFTTSAAFGAKSTEVANGTSLVGETIRLAAVCI